MIVTSVQENGDHVLRVASRDEGRTWHTVDRNPSPDIDLEIVEIPADITWLVEIAATIGETWLGTIRLKADTIPPHIKRRL